MFYFTLLCVILGMALSLGENENNPVGSLSNAENLPSPNNDNVFQSGPDPATDFNIFQDLDKPSETRNVFETGNNRDNVAEENLEQPPPSKLESPQNDESFDLSRNSNVFDSMNNEEKKDILIDKLPVISDNRNQFDLSRNSNVFDSVNNEEKKDLLTNKLQDIAPENGSENQNIRQDSPRQLADAPAPAEENPLPKSMLENRIPIPYTENKEKTNRVEIQPAQAPDSDRVQILNTNQLSNVTPLPSLKTIDSLPSMPHSNLAHSENESKESLSDPQKSKDVLPNQKLDTTNLNPNAKADIESHQVPNVFDSNKNIEIPSYNKKPKLSALNKNFGIFQPDQRQKIMSEIVDKTQWQYSDIHRLKQQPEANIFYPNKEEILPKPKEQPEQTIDPHYRETPKISQQALNVFDENDLKPNPEPNQQPHIVFSASRANIPLSDKQFQPQSYEKSSNTDNLPQLNHLQELNVRTDQGENLQIDSEQQQTHPDIQTSQGNIPPVYQESHPDVPTNQGNIPPVNQESHPDVPTNQGNIPPVNQGSHPDVPTGQGNIPPVNQESHPDVPTGQSNIPPVNQESHPDVPTGQGDIPLVNQQLHPDVPTGQGNIPPVNQQSHPSSPEHQPNKFQDMDHSQADNIHNRANLPSLNQQSQAGVVPDRANLPSLNQQSQAGIVPDRANLPSLNQQYQAGVVPDGANLPSLNQQSQVGIVPDRANLPSLNQQSQAGIVSDRANLPSLNQQSQAGIVSDRANLPSLNQQSHAGLPINQKNIFSNIKQSQSNYPPENLPETNQQPDIPINRNNIFSNIKQSQSNYPSENLPETNQQPDIPINRNNIFSNIKQPQPNFPLENLPETNQQPDIPINRNNIFSNIKQSQPNFPPENLPETNQQPADFSINQNKVFGKTEQPQANFPANRKNVFQSDRQDSSENQGVIAFSNQRLQATVQGHGESIPPVLDQNEDNVNQANHNGRYPNQRLNQGMEDSDHVPIRPGISSQTDSGNDVNSEMNDLRNKAQSIWDRRMGDRSNLNDPHSVFEGNEDEPLSDKIYKPVLHNTQPVENTLNQVPLDTYQDDQDEDKADYDDSEDNDEDKINQGDYRKQNALGEKENSATENEPGLVTLEKYASDQLNNDDRSETSNLDQRFQAYPVDSRDKGNRDNDDDDRDDNGFDDNYQATREPLYAFTDDPDSFGQRYDEDDKDVEEEEDDWYHDPDNVKEDDFDNDDEPKESTKGSEEDRDTAYVQNDDDDGDEDVDEDFWARIESRDKDHRDKVMNNDDDERDEKQQLEDEEKKYLGDLEDEEELIKKNHKPPTAPSKMVLFYTWMIVAILVMVIAASTYQAKCKGLLSGGNRQQSRGEDRKRLLDNEFV